MAIHFSTEEFKARQNAVALDLRGRGLDGCLMFKQESMYYLTGYDSFGYCFFQCLIFGADGSLTLLTRLPDLQQARLTSIIEDVRLWYDAPDADPGAELQRVLDDLGYKGKHLGIEFDAYGLTASSWRSVEAALDGFCDVTDASDLVGRRRAIKSSAELEYVRRAAELADEALDAAAEHAQPGAFEGDILAAMHGAIFRGGGDYAGNEFIIGSGPEATLIRYHSGRRNLDRKDQLTLEFAGAFRHYHACLMRTILVGAPDPEQVSMYEACRDALLACTEAVKPGATMGSVFDAHARIMDDAGYRDQRLEACGYGLGAVFTPVWVEQPMFYEGNALVIEANMVFFLHMILLDREATRATTLGHTVVVTEDGCEPLSKRPLDLIVNRVEGVPTR